MPNFTNNNREKKSYEKLEETIIKNNSEDSSFSNDVNLYLAKIYTNLTSKIRQNYLKLSEAKFQNKDYSEILRENLKIIYEELLSKTALLESLRYNHNQQFSIIGNRLKRPLILEEKDVENLFLETDEDSVLELLAKNMDWFSKTSKEVGIVSKNVLEKIPGDLEINGYTMRYIDDYISNNCVNGEIIKEYLLNYNEDLEDEEQLKKDEILNRVNEMVKATNNAFQTDIKLTDVYKFAACKRLEEYLYKIKAFSQIELYRQEAKNRKEGEETGISLDIQRDKNMNGTNFNTKYNVYIPFYTNCFRDHSDITNFSYMINRQVLDGDDPLKFPLDSLEDIPFRPFITFKLNPKRIFDLYSILEEYDNPKVNCFINNENETRLNKVYGYFADILHSSITKDDSKISELLDENDLQEFKKQVKKDRECFGKMLSAKEEEKIFGDN